MIPNADKLTKHFSFGEMEFDVAINREMAVRGFKQVPELFNAILKTGNLYTKKLEELSIEEYLTLEDIGGKRTKYYPILVEYLLEEMLEYAETDLKDFKDYSIYANAIIDYCKTNDIYEDYCLEYENGEIEEEQGICSLLGDFIALGFTQGNTQLKKKSKIKIAH